jgi:hypothetical protein
MMPFRTFLEDFRLLLLIITFAVFNDKCKENKTISTIFLRRYLLLFPIIQQWKNVKLRDSTKKTLNTIQVVCCRTSILLLQPRVCSINFECRCFENIKISHFFFEMRTSHDTERRTKPITIHNNY